MTIKLKVFVLILMLLSLLSGFLLAPQNQLYYDSNSIKLMDYGYEAGDFILKKQRIKVKRVFSKAGTTFLQEPDGSLHLYSKKSEEQTLRDIQKNQMSRLYFLKVWLFKGNCYLHQTLKDLWTSFSNNETSEGVRTLREEK